MKHLVMAALLITSSGCSVSSIYPAAGATLGGSVGSLGGPALGGAGALAGYSAGKAAQVGVKHKETIQALSEGDVSELVKQGLVEAREDGFFDGIVSEFYGLLKLACIILICWNALPLLYTWLLKREVKKNGIAKEV
tara:strand:+ start:1544 stop:1954 length:411 start_codon:yes stop_codon:yes gene_type:complete